MQKRNVLSKSFLFVCRLFYFSNFSITHVCVFVFLSQTRICRVHSNARVPPSSSHRQAQKISRRTEPLALRNSACPGTCALWGGRPFTPSVPYLLNTPSTAAFHPAYFFSRISSSIFGSYFFSYSPGFHRPSSVHTHFVSYFPRASPDHTHLPKYPPYKPLQSRKAPPRPEYLRVYS